jgi:hypothetical protein
MENWGSEGSCGVLILRFNAIGDHFHLVDS